MAGVEDARDCADVGAGRNTREIILVNEIGNYVVQLQYHIYAALVLLTRNDAIFNTVDAPRMRWC